MEELILKNVYTNYPTYKEGKELYYRIDKIPTIDFQITSSTKTLIDGVSTTTAIEFLSSNPIPASNTPFYVTITGTIVRSVETNTQITIITNELLGACHIPSIWDVTFIADVG